MGNSQGLEGLSTAQQSKDSKILHNRNSILNESTKLPASSDSRRDNHDDTSSSKKKFLRLGTIRRKLAKTLRPGKNSDFRKHMRELLQSWSAKEIQSLIEDYDGLDALKDLMILTNCARPSCNVLETDLVELYEKGILTDLIIVYNGTSYPVHKSIICCRCQYFCKYLAKCNTGNNKITLDMPDLLLSKQVFSSLLKYIYSGETADLNLIDILSNLGERFGMLNALGQDLRKLFEREKYTDMILVYPKTVPSDQNLSGQPDMESAIDNILEIPCHTAVLVARSAYFFNLLNEKLDQSDPQHSKPLRLVIDEKIIPRCFIRIVLSCLYTDVVDLSTIIKWKVDDDGNGEADRLLTVSELAMELYEIGQFLEIPALMKGCEDNLVANLKTSSLLSVLEWSSQPFGSVYVYRQCLQYFQEEFMQLCRVPVFLCNIPKKFFMAVIKSDFLQANEEFLLAVVIKWGEWQIAKATEKPGSNSPGNSLPRRSPKRRDINNDVLRELIAPLLPHVRLKHVLPSNSSVLHMAYQRGLLQRPFPFDVVALEKLPPNVVYWVHSMRCSEYVRPRLFMQYVYEAKLILHERLLSESEATITSLSMQSSLSLPDMLPRGVVSRDKRQANRNHAQDYDDPPCDPPCDRALQFSQCQLEELVIRDMVLLEKRYKMAPEAVKAFSLVPDNDIIELIQLRVVREFGLPDDVAMEVFRQVPDIVDSASSSNSSKQNSLSKVGPLLQEECSLRSQKTSDSLEIAPGKTSSLETVDILGSSLGATSFGSVSFDVDDGGRGMGATGRPHSNTLSFAHSPLDLPVRDEHGSIGRDFQLPNVILDT